MKSKATPKPNTYEALEPDVIEKVCKLIDEWNELASVYPKGPKYYHIRKGVRPVVNGQQQRTIPANMMPVVIIAVYEFIKENEDWQELWNEVITGIKESAFLQGKTDSNALRPSLGWIFMQSKIPGMAGTYKNKGMELILSGKYAGGVNNSTPEMTEEQYADYLDNIRKSQME